jgi:protein phosphatase
MAELRWGATTDSGLVREANEDAYVSEPLVFAVADGMGGHRAGEVASEIASRIVRERLSSGAPNVDVVVAAVLEANAAIFHAAHSNAAQQGMGTTVTALVVLSATADDSEQLALVNVGDSRTYLHRDRELTRITVDHSYVQELVATGHITEAEARTHPRRNIVTRALGIEPTVRVDAWVLPIVQGDRFILCSDGLVDEVPDHEIADVAGGMPDPQRAADELVAMANRHGGRDNVTVIVVDVVAGADPRAAMVDPDDAQVDATLGRTAVLPATAATGVLGGEEDAAVTSASGGAPSAGAGAAGVGAQGGSATAVTDGDDTTEMDSSVVEPAVAPRRRFTLRMLLVLLAIAAIVALIVTLVAVALSDDDSPAPTTTVPTTVADTEPTTDFTTTDVDVTTTERATATTRPPTTRPPVTSATAPPTTAP